MNKNNYIGIDNEKNNYIGNEKNNYIIHVHIGIDIFFFKKNKNSIFLPKFQQKT